MIEERQKLEAIRDGIVAFMASPAYPAYVASRKKEIADLKDEIIKFVPQSRKDEIESYMLRGDLRTNEEYLTLFEETLASLGTEILDLQESEQPSEIQH